MINTVEEVHVLSYNTTNDIITAVLGCTVAT